MEMPTKERQENALIKLEEVRKEYIEKYGDMANSSYAQKKIYEEAAAACFYSADTLRRIENDKTKRRGQFV